MAKVWPRFWAVPLTLLALGAAEVSTPLRSAANAQQTSGYGKKSWTESITSPFKQGFDKLGRAINPKSPAPGSEEDAVSLNGKGRPTADLYVATARLCEQSGKTAEAERQYQLALTDRPNDLPALLGYAHLKEQQGKPNEAIQLYQQAAKAHPTEPSVFNNLGMCHARMSRLDDAVAAMSRAVELEPKSPLYRNNIATVLVDQGKFREAFAHLREVHAPAVAYYNMGYLLNKKGQTQAAMQHFALALKADPSMEAARRWHDYLQRSTAQARLSEHPIGAGVKITTGQSQAAAQPVMPQPNMVLAPDESTPRRLPPTSVRQPDLNGPSLPGISYQRRTAPSAPYAPLPPPETNSAVRPLPRVY